MPFRQGRILPYVYSVRPPGGSVPSCQRRTARVCRRAHRPNSHRIIFTYLQIRPQPCSEPILFALICCERGRKRELQARARICQLRRRPQHLGLFHRMGRNREEYHFLAGAAYRGGALHKRIIVLEWDSSVLPAEIRALPSIGRKRHTRRLPLRHIPLPYFGASYERTGNLLELQRNGNSQNRTATRR